jgi:sec-independent protein translocase protein TatC
MFCIFVCLKKCSEVYILIYENLCFQNINNIAMALDQYDAGDDYYKGDASSKALPSGEKEMGFLDHLEELRWHIIRSVSAIIFFAVLLFLFPNFLFETVIFAPKNPDFLSYRLVNSILTSIGVPPFTPEPFTLQVTELGEEFMIHIQVSAILGFVLAFPYVFWEIWKFIKPGLYPKEQKAVRGVVIFCSLLFFLGVLFGYFVIAPFAVNFLAGYSIAEAVETQPRLSSFVNYMVMFTVPAGLVFELPIVVYFFSKLGLLTPKIMREYRRHAIVIILIVAAIITPPDVITQSLISIPLYVLYEISITISARVEKEAEKEMLTSD